MSMRFLPVLAIMIAVAASGCTAPVPGGQGNNQTPGGQGLSNVTDFQGCVSAGYPVLEGNPRQCATPDGRVFTEELQACTGLGGASMTIDQAREIAKTSECGDRLKDSAYCNPGTGTWWIDLDLERAGCSPACVVTVDTGQAEINWRCTGLVVPPIAGY
jgi:hypothetical protein